MDNGQTVEQIKTDAINEFVCTMIGALGGFVEESTITLATLHRVMQNYCRDSFGIELPHITEAWGDEIAELCGHKKTYTNLAVQSFAVCSEDEDVEQADDVTSLPHAKALLEKLRTEQPNKAWSLVAELNI